MNSCPGGNNFKYPKIDIIKCPGCSGEVEIWSDENKAACEHCGKEISRDVVKGCIEWCPYAKHCFGETAYNKITAKGPESKTGSK